MVLVGLNWLFLYLSVETRRGGGDLLILHLHFQKKKKNKISEVFSILRLKINKSECWTFNSPVRAGPDLSCGVGNVAGDVMPHFLEVPLSWALSPAAPRARARIYKTLFPPSTQHFSAVWGVVSRDIGMGGGWLCLERKIWYLLFIILSHSNYPAPKRSLVMWAGSVGTDCTSQ